MAHPALLHYEIRPADLAGHIFEVSLTVPDPRSGMAFALPAWIPGSYMIREFARNIVWLRAQVDGETVAVEKRDKHTWRLGTVPAQARTVQLHYAVYAWDLSVRCAYLDQSRGFFNGTQVFLRVLGREDWACQVRIAAPADPAYRAWSIATALRPVSGRGGARRNGFGLYEANDYDELIDHPVEMGVLSRAQFEVRGVPHEIVLSGRHDCDLDRLSADLARACEAQCAVFGDAPPPFARYVFLTAVVGEGYGGLEHQASTALICSRRDLPYAGMAAASEAYIGFLGLCSHEYFHAWNVKRIKPAALTPYDLQAENYTRLLWVFEGFTSYYDDLALVRAGLITPTQYFELLAKTLSAVQRNGGRAVQSVTESSFDAWIKYYRQDENAPNAIVSYYQKGALIALLLDLSLRAKTQGAASLDTLMRLLWTRFGATGEGVGEDALPGLIREATGVDLRRMLKLATESTADLPLEKAFKPLGVTLDWRTTGSVPEWGVKCGSEGDCVRLTQVYTGGAAHAAGLSAGDVIVACDGLRVRAGGLDALLARRQAGSTMQVHAFRRDELMCFELTLTAPAAHTAHLAAAAPNALRAAWLGVNPPQAARRRR